MFFFGKKFLTFYFKESPEIVLGGGHTLIRLNIKGRV